MPCVAPPKARGKKIINSLKKVKTQNLLISRQLITCFNRWLKCGLGYQDTDWIRLQSVSENDMSVRRICFFSFLSDFFGSCPKIGHLHI